MARYRPLVDRLGSRDDLSDLLWELNGETGSSHAYETPPAGEEGSAAAAGLPRARTWPGNRRRLGDQPGLHGDNSARQARSPLTAPGVGVRAGDRIVAVNGRPVGPAGPAELLRGTAGKPVELRVAGDGRPSAR